MVKVGLWWWGEGGGGSGGGGGGGGGDRETSEYADRERIKRDGISRARSFKGLVLVLVVVVVVVRLKLRRLKRLQATLGLGYLGLCEVSVAGRHAAQEGLDEGLEHGEVVLMARVHHEVRLVRERERDVRDVGDQRHVLMRRRPQNRAIGFTHPSPTLHLPFTHHPATIQLPAYRRPTILPLPQMATDTVTHKSYPGH